MPTVEEILRESGFTNEQISALEPKTITAFSNVLSAAERERKLNTDFYENQIAPSLVAWDEEKQKLENDRARIAAENAFYKTQNEAARASGFIPSDAPGYQPSRDQGGRYVANGGGTPGSPTFEPGELIRRAGDGLATIADIDWKHRSLFDGKPMPMAPSELVRQADARHVSPAIYAEQVFGFQKREQELAVQRQTEHDNKIKQDAVTERDRYWAERTGSNPDIRQPQGNVRMAEIQRGVSAGAALPGSPNNKLNDPLMLSETERRVQTRAGIRNELSQQD